MKIIKKIVKNSKGVAEKILYSFMVMMMLLQPVSAPGALRALASDETTTETVSAVASEEVEEEAEEEVEEAIEETVEEPAPVAEEEPIVETIVPVEEVAPVVEETIALPIETVDTQAIEITGEGQITPEAASIIAPEKEIPVEENSDKDAENNELKQDIWSRDGDKATTNNPVEKDVKYTAPQNEDVTVTFTKLPENPGTLSIEEIILTPEQIEMLGAISNKAYDITSTMENGTFEYDLTLPKPEGEDNVQIKYAEEKSQLDEARTIEDVDVKNDKVEAEGVDHFTIFVVTQTVDSSDGSAQIVDSENSKLTSSDNIRMESDGQWTTSNYSSERYVEFRFNPILPAGSAVTGDVTLSFEYQRDALAVLDNNYKARLLIDNGSSWDVLASDVKVDNFNQDKTFTITIPASYVNTVDKINNLKIRFQAVGKKFGGNLTGDGIKTRHDYVALDFSYELATPTLVSPADGIYRKTSDLNKSDWSDIAGMGVVYYYQSSRNTNFSSLLYDSVALNSSEIMNPGEPEGKYYWRAKACDNLGNCSDWGGPWEITVDNTAPTTPQFSSPADNTLTNVNAVTLNWTGGDDNVSGVKGYTLRYVFYPADGGSSTNWSSGFVAGTQKTRSGSFGHGEGRYVMYVKTTDNAGNESLESNPLTIVYDNTAPAVPTGIYFKDTMNDKNLQCGEVTSARNFDVYWDANVESDFDHYEYISFNADGSTGSIRTFTTPYFNASWWTAPTEGTYGVQIRAVDESGNASAWFGGEQGIANSCTYISDWTAPTKLTIIKPSTEQYFKTNSIRNEWTAGTDNYSGIVQYRIEYIYDDGHTFSGAPYRTTTSTWRNHTPNISEQGGVTIRVQAFDRAGNEGEWSEPVHYYYDATAPATPSLIAPANNLIVKGIPSLTNSWNSVSDAVSYIYESYNDSNATSLRWHQELAETSKTAPNVVEATFWWRVKAIDAAGNESGWSDLWKVTIDNTAPTIASVSSDGRTYNLATSSPQRITVTFNEDMTTVPTIDVHSNVTSYYVDDCNDGDAKTFCFDYTINAGEELTHTIYISGATDLAGNIMTQDSAHTFDVDTIAPTVTFINPTPSDGLITNNNDQIIKVSLSEDVSSCYLDSGFNNGDFEKGNLSDWNTSGNANWYIDSSNKHEGSYSARSGNMWELNNVSSTLQRSVTTGANSSLSFWWMVSSESSYDYLRFYLDGTHQAGISGGVNWQQMQYNLGAGNHNLQWIYSKDFSVTSGSDAGWIDDLRVSGEMGESSQIMIVDNQNHTASLSLSDMGDGLHSYSVHCEDLAINTGSSDIRTLAVDTIAPTATISYSTTNWTNSDVTATLNPSESVTVTNNSGNTTYTFTDNGTFTFEFVDLAGNTGSATATVSNIDKTAPIVDAGTDKLVNAQFTQEATVDGSISAVASYAWSQVSGPGTIIFGTLDAEDTTISADIDGAYVIRLTVVDNAGNSAYDEFTLIWDTTLPVTTLTIDPATNDGDNGWYVSNPEITLTATDDNGIEKIEYQLNSDSGAWITYTGPVTIADGTWQFYYRSIDKASNISSMGPKDVKVDTNDPDNVSNFEGEYRSDTTDVKLTWNADNSNIYKVYIYRGGSRSFSVNSGSRIAKNDDNDEDYTDDDDIELGETYYYKILTTDEAGNKSDVRIIKIVIPEDGTSNAVSVDEGTETLPEGTVLGTETNDENEGDENKDDEGGVLGDQDSIGGKDVLGDTNENLGKENIFKKWPWLLLLIIILGGIWYALRKRKKSSNKISKN